MNPSLPLITQTAEYAMRAMSRLASSGETFERATELSIITKVPKPYLSKILRKMVVAGLVEGKRGHHGGFRLARPPEQITLKDILVAVDTLPSGRCAFGLPSCDLSNPCPLHDAWSELKKNYNDWMRQHTLADLEDAAWSPRKTAPKTV